MPHKIDLSYPIDSMVPGDEIHPPYRVIGREVECPKCDNHSRDTGKYDLMINPREREDAVSKHTEAAVEKLNEKNCQSFIDWYLP